MPTLQWLRLSLGTLGEGFVLWVVCGGGAIRSGAMGKGGTVAIGADLHSIEWGSVTPAASALEMAAALAAIGLFGAILWIQLS